MIVDLSLNGRIHERREHDLKFKQVAKGFISKGYLDPSDGNPLTTHCDVVVVLALQCVCFYGYCYCICVVFISMVTVTVSIAVFVLDTGFHVFVWVGKDATPHEKGGGLVIAHVS